MGWKILHIESGCVYPSKDPSVKRLKDFPLTFETPLDRGEEFPTLQAAYDKCYQVIGHGDNDPREGLMFIPTEKWW